ncbi:G-protein coupled receptor 54, partial [Biomphalaria glabrata]
MHNVTNIFLLSLATADLLLVTTCVPVKVSRNLIFTCVPVKVSRNFIPPAGLA